MDISFTSDEYSVEEGDMTVTVGVVLSAQDSIQSPIWFTLVTFDGSSAMGNDLTYVCVCVCVSNIMRISYLYTYVALLEVRPMRWYI